MSQSSRRGASWDAGQAAPRLDLRGHLTRMRQGDTIRKLRLYHQASVPHYWIIDPRDATLTVMRWSGDGYVTIMRAERGEVVRAERFDTLELAVGTLFGNDPPDSERV